MSNAYHRKIWPVVAWVIFPVIPALLGSAYHQTVNFGMADPREWEWGSWVVLTGPLVGYGFLAGATLGLPDRPDPRWFRRWFARRSAWVAIGPWFGSLSAVAVGYAVAASVGGPTINDWMETKIPHSIAQFMAIAAVGWVAYGWLLVAIVALRRARRQRQFLRSLGRGLVGAIVLVGSLFGTFWTITAVWREYFFDKRIMPLVLATTSLALASGCATPITQGEVRRRDLFQALLMAWLLGTALAWRWWSRPRSKDIR